MIVSVKCVNDVVEDVDYSKENGWGVFMKRIL